jgi:hypothetical protein
MTHLRSFCALALLILNGGTALAHAIVLGSTPRADDIVEGEETAVEIRFNSRIDVGRSTLRLFKIDGDAVTLPVSDASSEDVLRSKATGLTPGKYRLHWQTLSPDGHITHGDIFFGVSR